MLRQRISVLASLVLALSPAIRADAAACDVAGCTAELASSGVIVDDVFHDAAGRSAQSLPVYGRLVNNWPGCPEHVDFAGAGHSIPPFDCPGEYVSDAVSPTVAQADAFLGALDRQWWQPCRLANATLASGCVADWSCIADGLGGNYLPWEGLVFDLGGPSSQVALFATNDHGPQPCESLEYTVYFSDNPFAHDASDVVLHPDVDGVDPMRWNRARLTRVYTGGWTQSRAADPGGHGATCGDTATYSVEMDSFVQVFTLPCAVSMRYVAVVAGNDGRDFPSCAYDSNEAELDAVAGLLVDGTAVCPDADADGASDCACTGAPTRCDCDDADPTVHPGAIEACDSTRDLDCDGTIGATCGASCTGVVCPGARVCANGACVDLCAGVTCPAGQACSRGVCAAPCSCFHADLGCSAAGTVCDAARMACVVPSCVGVTCSGAGETCVDASGTCEPLCGPSTVCPSGQHCVSPGGCVPIPPDAGTDASATPDAGIDASATLDAGRDAAAVPDAGARDASGADAGDAMPSNAGCGCATAGASSRSGAGLALVLLAAMLARSRRRSVRRP